MIADRQGRYQICGPNAFNRYGYDDQLPNRIYAYNNRLSGDRAIAAVNLTLIKVADERLGETEEQKTADGETAIYSSRARTLIDAVYDWSRFGSVPRAYDWIRADLGAGRVRPVDLVRITVRYGDIGTDPADRRFARSRRRRRTAPAKARTATPHAEESDSLGPRARPTRQGRSALGHRLERTCLSEIASAGTRTRTHFRAERAARGHRRSRERSIVGTR